MLRHPVDPRTQAWLAVGGSLTAQLRRHGAVRIVVLQQGHLPLWPEERSDLGAQRGYVREVAILVDDRTAVWARSATSQPAAKGPWRALANLGSRPLAELLFHDRHITRSPLRAHPVTRYGLHYQHLVRSLEAGGDAAQTITPRWARSSLFTRDHEPLRVYEAFAPWIVQRPCGAPHHRLPQRPA